MILEGPFFVRGPGENLFLVYSANDTRSDDYALGALAFKGTNLLDAASWQKRKEPVLFKANGVLCDKNLLTSVEASQIYLSIVASPESLKSAPQLCVNHSAKHAPKESNALKSNDSVRVG